MKAAIQRIFSLLFTAVSALAQQYVISTVVGGPGIPTPVAATSASVDHPTAIAVGPSGEIYFIGQGFSVYKIERSGVITRVAGNGGEGFSGDGGPATSAQLERPFDVAVDVTGNLYIGGGSRIRRVAPDGIITTLAGNGSIGYSGDGGPAASAQLSYLSGLAVDAAGNLYLAECANNRIRKVATNGCASQK